MNSEKKTRLDELLVSRGLVASRSRARDLIKRGLVRVSGEPAVKPGALTEALSLIELDERQAAFVSRGAVKLEAALDAFGFDPAGRISLDLGASTGGFSQLLLQRGAVQVFAVDVGHGQLATLLRVDPRIINLEGRDARALTSVDIPRPVGAITADLSFISLTKVLPKALAFAAPGAWLVALVKPQFEVGRAEIGKGGMVRDEAARARAVASVQSLVDAQPGWQTLTPIPSPLAGQDGNLEFLLGARFVPAPSPRAPT